MSFFNIEIFYVKKKRKCVCVFVDHQLLYSVETEFLAKELTYICTYAEM